MAKKDIKYKQEFVDRLPGMFKNGEDVIEVCVELGICRAAFYKWVKKYPDFAEAYKEGKEKSEAWWRKLGRAGACGKADINPTVWIFNMKAKFGMSETSNINVNVDAKAEITQSPKDELKKRGIPIPKIAIGDIDG